MTGLSGAKARPLTAILAATLLLAAAPPALAGTTVSPADHATAQSQLPGVDQATVRCQAAVSQCLHTCRVDNRRADRQCEARYAALQAGSCKPNPSQCTCWATPPTCTPITTH